MKNVYPISDSTLSIADKERLLQQRAIVIWLIGLSGSGKSTIANALEKIHQQGFLTQLLDGDNLRIGINNNLGFSEEDRTENIRRTAETAKLFMNCGIITICSFITPTHQLQQMAKNIIGEERFFETFVDCSIEVCEKRDVKGLYVKARKGEILNFTGINAPFEEPTTPNLKLKTDIEDIDLCLDKLFSKVLPLIQYD